MFPERKAVKQLKLKYNYIYFAYPGSSLPLYNYANYIGQSGGVGISMQAVFQLNYFYCLVKKDIT